MNTLYNISPNKRKEFVIIKDKFGICNITITSSIKGIIYLLKSSIKDDVILKDHIIYTTKFDNKLSINVCIDSGIYYIYILNKNDILMNINMIGKECNLI